jgi:poly(3-hydroxybutyrate) depolymerase
LSERWLAGWLGALATVVSPGLGADPLPRGEIEGVVEIPGRTMDYRAWIPPDVPTGTRVPMLVGLHGRSRHIERYAFYFLDIGRHAPRSTPVIVLAPRIDWDAPWIETQRLLFGAMDRITHDYGADETRIGVLGFSMGASSALNLARHNPRRFAAVWAASGLFPDDALTVLRHRPTRVVLSWSGPQGQCDDTADVARDLDHGRGLCRAVVFPGGAHEPHLEMFQDEALLRWFVGAR